MTTALNQYETTQTAMEARARKPARQREADLLQRAVRAYLRAAIKAGHVPMQPSMLQSGVQVHRHLEYVVLRNVSGVLAILRVLHCGTLKTLKRWPKPYRQPLR